MKNISVDIILCCYNSNFVFLEQSINSILIQTCPCWNLYIIDDGSTNDLYGFLKEKYLNNLKIHYYKNEKNIGLSSSLNIGHSLGKSKFICWTSDDNCYESTFVEKMLNIAEKNDFDFVRSLEMHIDAKDKFINIFDPRYGTSGLNKEFIIYDGYLGASHLYKRNLFNLTTGYDSTLAGIEDLDMYYQFMENKPKIGFIKEVLYKYRVGTSSFNRTKVLNIRKKFIKKWKINKI